MAKFLCVKVFGGGGVAAVFSEDFGGEFALDLERLHLRILNLRRAGLNTAEEECAMDALLQGGAKSETWDCVDCGAINLKSICPERCPLCNGKRPQAAEAILRGG